MRSAIAVALAVAAIAACSGSQVAPPSRGDIVKAAQQGVEQARVACAVAVLVKDVPRQVRDACLALKAAEADTLEILQPWPAVGSAGAGGGS